MTDRFSHYIKLSFGLHGAILLIIFFRAVMIPSDPIDISNAIRVDMVDLPKKMASLPEEAKVPEPIVTPKAELEKVEATPPPKPEAPKMPTKKEIAKAQDSAINKIKAMSAIDKIKNEVNKEKTAKAKAEPVRGNHASAGNSLSGLEKLDFDRYFGDIKEKVNSNLSIPQWLAGADLRAQVLVLIDEQGYIIKRTVLKSSNNEIFDSKVIEALDKSSPLPPPPDRLKGLLATSGITFNFPQ